MAQFETVVLETAKGSYGQFHFPQGVIANGRLFASGIIGTDASGNVPEEDKEEFRLAWQGIATLLKEAGSGLDSIVEYTSFHSVALTSPLFCYYYVRLTTRSKP